MSDNRQQQMRRKSQVMYIDELNDDDDDEPEKPQFARQSKATVSPIDELPKRKSIAPPSSVNSEDTYDEIPRKKSIAINQQPRKSLLPANKDQILDPNRLAHIENLVRKKSIAANNGVQKNLKIVHHIEDDDDSTSTITEGSGVVSPSNYLTKKLLSGFHPYHDEETDVMALQCCTCCIGCWRSCSHRCTGCENFLSCPIYCWCGVLLPIFLILLIGFILTIVYATGAFTK